MDKKYDFIIVGAGLNGLVLAHELVKKNKKVLVLEKGGFINKMGEIRHAFLFYDKFALASSRQGVIIYRVIGVGGTSVVSCGNAVRFPDSYYNKLGIDLKAELDATEKDCCVHPEGLPDYIGKASQRIKQEADKLGHSMKPMPKFSITGTCAGCGNCYYGCRYQTKWSSAECLKQIRQDGFDLVTNFPVKRVIDDGLYAVGVQGSGPTSKAVFYGSKIILCAGGIGTPIILQNSKLQAGENLFVDLFNVTYGYSSQFNQRRELPMSVVCDKYHISDKLVMSPFVDNFFSLIATAGIKHIPDAFRLGNFMGIMTKIADQNTGRVYRDGVICKKATDSDKAMLKKGSAMAKEILLNCGVNPGSIFVTNPTGAHPGGTAAIGNVVDLNLETRLKNLYVCDCSVLPTAPGLPPMLTLIALAKWFAKRQ